jgi:SNF family Na+-dependent transporter
MDIKVSSMNSDGSLTISLPSISTLKVAALRTIAFPIFPTQITLKMNSASETPRTLFNILFNVFVHIYQLLCRKKHIPGNSIGYRFTKGIGRISNSNI